MLFSTPLFLFYFLPIVILIYFLIRIELRNLWLLVSSFGFFMWGAPAFSVVILLSAVLDWCLGGLMGRVSSERWRKVFVSLSICGNLGILVYYKYTNFLLENINILFSLLNWNPFVWEKVLLPIGVSFLVFEKITYTVDIYRGITAPNRSLVQYLTYVFFFPKVLAGPIVKYHDLAAQLERRTVTLDKVYDGVGRFIYGLGKKVFLADSLGEFADQAFSLGPGLVSTGDAWLGALCFTFQIYMDFSSYSDMAIGLGKIFGFDLMENFNFPYISRSFSEFWQRWHISLSTWIRDYVYFPLGGSKCGRIRNYGNLFFVFIISGIWHGANWTFIVWGIYHGCVVMLERAWGKVIEAKFSHKARVAGTFILLIFSMVIFRAPDTGHALQYLCCMVTYQPVTIELGNFLLMELYVKVALAITVLMSFAPLFLPSPESLTKWRRQRVVEVLLPALLFMLFIAASAKAVTATFHPFLYFRF